MATGPGALAEENRATPNTLPGETIMKIAAAFVASLAASAYYMIATSGVLAMLD
jgi:hypothetical protein